ncbi:hypothetical protein ACHWQZ_G004991 [Mnemiopsis leidyi]
MPTFSKFITSQRGAQQILDFDGYIYSRKKSSDTALTSTWRCAKYNPPTKCKCHIYLALADNSVTLGIQPHNHSADGSVPARQEVLLSLKRKAADQPLSATQNLIAFPSDFWNHFDRVLEDPDFPRTSNMVEGFHRL